MINLELEIREQPSILASVIGENEAVATEIVKAAKAKGVAGIYFAARGTSDHACIYAQYLFGILAGLPCTLGTPSVFTKYGAHIDLSKYLVVGVSQSGKAEDVLEVLKSAKADGAVTVAVTNDTEPYLLVEHHKRTQDRCSMDHCRKKKVIGSLNTKKDLADLKMTAAAYRKKLCQSLKQSQQYSFKPFHHLFPPLKNPMIATTSITIPSIITTGAATILRKSNIAQLNT